MSPTSEQFDLLLRQLRERLEDGRGETIYEIGIGEGKKYFQARKFNILLYNTDF